MAITKEKKKEIAEKVSGIVGESASVVFVNFHGLPVSESSEMRRSLRGKNLGYYVAKKTLAKRVLSDAGIEGEVPDLPGELALVYGEDQIAPAREIYEFQKKWKDSLSIVGGIFENRFLGKSEMSALAMIPSRKTLEAQFVNLINSPIQRFAVVLNAIAEKRA